MGLLGKLSKRKTAMGEGTGPGEAGDALVDGDMLGVADMDRVEDAVVETKIEAEVQLTTKRCLGVTKPLAIVMGAAPGTPPGMTLTVRFEERDT